MTASLFSTHNYHGIQALKQTTVIMKKVPWRGKEEKAIKKIIVVFTICLSVSSRLQVRASSPVKEGGTGGLGRRRLSGRLRLSPTPLARPTGIHLSLRGAPDSATSCALHMQVLTQQSMSREHHELLLESNCFINYCLCNFKILINS